MEKIAAALLEKIAIIDLFHEVPALDIKRLVTCAHEKKLLAGEFFFLQDDPAERMYLLLKGRVRLSQVGPGGQQALIRVIKPVEIFALVAMIRAGGYLVTAQAAEDSQALFWSRQELMDFVKQTPQMALNAMRVMAEQLGEIQERFRQVTTERVEQRLAHTLIRLAAESGRKVDEGVLIDMPLTRQDLAEMSGTTLYTASRMLSQWQEQGLVISHRASVTLRDPLGLARVVQRE